MRLIWLAAAACLAAAGCDSGGEQPTLVQGSSDLSDSQVAAALGPENQALPAPDVNAVAGNAAENAVDEEPENEASTEGQE